MAVGPGTVTAELSRTPVGENRIVDGPTELKLSAFRWSKNDAAATENEFAEPEWGVIVELLVKSGPKFRLPKLFAP
jgi:hypothetical protein